MRYHLNFRDLNGRTGSRSAFHREAAKLRRHLIDFRSELVDLWASVTPLPRSGGFQAQMRLSLPSGTLSAEGHGFSRGGAWIDVAREMVVRIERHKARLTGSRSRQRRAHERQRWTGHAPPKTSRQAHIQAAYPSLLEFLRTEVKLHVERGNLPRKFADPVELADEVAMEALANGKPQGLSHEHWFIKLGYERLMECVDQARHQRNGTRGGQSLDTVMPHEEGPEGLTDEEDLVSEWIEEPRRPRFGEDIPDPRSMT